MKYVSLRKGNRIGKHGGKAVLAVTCILTLVILIAFIGNFGSTKSLVLADTVKGVGVGIYWDQACTNETLLLNWERIDVGSDSNLTVYVRNEVNSPALLWLGTSNWTPSASSDYISLNWNYSGQVLSIGQVIPLELTLAVSPTISEITDFSFKTIITITEQ